MNQNNLTKEQEAQIFEENQNIIYRVIHNTFGGDGAESANCGSNIDDLFQIGSIGLLKAIRTYDPSKNVPFINYAAATVRYEIMRWTNPNYNKRNLQQLLNDRTISVNDCAPNYDENSAIDDYDRVAKAVSINDISKASYTDDTLWRLEFDEFKNSLTAEDRIVLDGLMNGKNQVELASELGVSKQAIHQRIQKLRRKYHEYVD